MIKTHSGILILDTSQIPLIQESIMNRKKTLDEYLKKHKVPELILKKVIVNSFLTDNFAYGALRIGNSIGDMLDISIEIIILDEIAKRYDLKLNTTEHAELHTKGISEEDLEKLIRAAIHFENIKNNKKGYSQILKGIAEFIREKVNTIIENG
jgi:hypothetical protein